jgi:hypothetical protein
MNSVERKIHNDLFEADRIFKTYAALFEINPFKKTPGGRPSKKESEVCLPEMRRAFVWYMVNNSTLTLKQMAAIMKLKNHTSIIYLRKRARQFYEMNDPKFNTYYSYLTSIL